MTTIQQLKREIAKEKKKERAKRVARIKVDEKIKLKRQLFNLKYGKKVKTLKGIGKSVGKRFSNAGKSLSKQRKSKTGIGGYLQRIADNQ